MPDEVGSALRGTVGDLEGGAPRMGAQAALPVVAGWQRRLEETGHPDLLPVAGTLSELRLQLSGGVRDPAAVGALLGTLSGQARGVAGSELGAGVSGELTRLSALLAAQSRVLVALAS
jgi:hypothetical protein